MTHAQLITLIAVGSHLLLSSLCALVMDRSWKRRLGHGEGFGAAVVLGMLWFLFIPMMVFNFVRGGDWLCARSTKNDAA